MKIISHKKIVEKELQLKGKKIFNWRNSYNQDADLEYNPKDYYKLINHRKKKLK